MRLYELTCLISSEFPAEELNSLQEKIISFIQEEKGILVKVDLPFKKKNDNLLLGLDFQLNPEKIETLEKKIKEIRQISRHLLLSKPPAAFIKEAARKPSLSPRKKAAEEKVELKEIEKKLEEILGQ